MAILTKEGKLPGGSTITQQLVKNLLNHKEITPERKMREMVEAVRLETSAPKDKVKDLILEYYINAIYFGQSNYGIEMASQTYFKKPAKELTIDQAALLAGLVKGPDYYSPYRLDENNKPARAQSRRDYVLQRLREDHKISDEDYNKFTSKDVVVEESETPLQKGAFYFLNDVNKAFKRTASIQQIINPGSQTPAGITSDSFTVKTTIDPEIQRITEETLQNKLAGYEAKLKRAEFTGPVGSLLKLVNTFNMDWEEALAVAHSKLYDVRWPLAVVLKSDGKGAVIVGLKDGREVKLKASNSQDLKGLRVWDLVHARPDNHNGATLLIPPHLQGAVVVMEANTGRILSMMGGFSYAASELNRASDPKVKRQPGSTFKPFLYMTALNMGYQPNTLLPNLDPYLPIPGSRTNKVYSVHNFDQDADENVVTMRYAIEHSMNRPAVQMMAKFDETPQKGLHRVVQTAMDFGVLDEETPDYSTVLGSKEVRLIDMAAAYASIANISAPYNPSCPNCLRPTPSVIDEVSLRGTTLWSRDRLSLKQIKSVDRASIYQMRRILEGTVARGTASSIKDLAGYVAGKTGTTNGFRDSWFIGFSNDLVIATWVGYDDDKIAKSFHVNREYAGAKMALPIAADIFKAVFEKYPERKQPLSSLPEDLKGTLAEYPIDLMSGQISQGKVIEVFRLGQNAQPMETQNLIMNKLTQQEEWVLNTRTQSSQGDYPYEEPDYETNDSLFNQRPSRPAPVDPYDQPYFPGIESPFDSYFRGSRQGYGNQNYPHNDPYYGGYGR